MKTIEVPSVLFIEGIPKPKQRPRWSGKFMYSPKTKWEKEVEKFCRDLDCRFNYALKVDVTFYMPRPKSHYRTGKYSHILKDSSPIKWHTQKPDRDNLDKAILDAMTKAGIFSDDCIICDGRISKKWANKKSGALVSISNM